MSGQRRIFFFFTGWINTLTHGGCDCENMLLILIFFFACSLQHGKSSSTGNLLEREDMAMSVADYGLHSRMAAQSAAALHGRQQRPYSVAVPGFSQVGGAFKTSSQTHKHKHIYDTRAEALAETWARLSVKFGASVSLRVSVRVSDLRSAAGTALLWQPVSSLSVSPVWRENSESYVNAGISPASLHSSCLRRDETGQKSPSAAGKLTERSSERGWRQKEQAGGLIFEKLEVDLCNSKPSSSSSSPLLRLTWNITCGRCLIAQSSCNNLNCSFCLSVQGRKRFLLTFTENWVMSPGLCAFENIRSPSESWFDQM